MALNVTALMPTDVRPANDNVLNVFAPLIIIDVASALVKLTLLNVCPPPLNVGAGATEDIVDVPALKDKLVAVAKFHTVPIPVIAKVTALPLREIVRIFVLFEEIAPT